MKHLNPNSESFWQKTSILLIKVYQRARPALDRITLSVFGVVSECKHSPSCSEFTVEQIRRHGTIAGVVKGAKRIISCH